MISCHKYTFMYVHVVRFDCLQTKIFLSGKFWKKYYDDATYIQERNYLIKGGENVYNKWYDATIYKGAIQDEVYHISKKLNECFGNEYAVITESLICLTCKNASAGRMIAQYLLHNYGVECATTSAIIGAPISETTVT